MKIFQEEDRYGTTRILLALAGVALVCVIAALICERMVGPGREPDRRESGAVLTGFMSNDRDGERRRARDEMRLESWGPVSSTSVHLPIERAMELSLPRLQVDRPEAIGVDEHLGASVPRESVFEDTAGNKVRLGDLLDGTRPVLLVLAYERCPKLCGLVLRGAAKAVKGLGWRPGEELRAVTVSFDAEESRDLARAKQATLLEEVGIPGSVEAWPFLVGREPEIRALTDAIGFRYYRDPASGELAHPAVVVVLTPGGRISRYLYGIDFSPRDLKLALVEAGAGKTGSAFERVLLRCYRWDGTTHRYEVAVLGVMRATGAAIGAVVLGLVGALWRRERAARGGAA